MSLRTSPQKKPIDAPTKMQQTWLEKEHAQSVLLPGVLRHVGQRRGESCEKQHARYYLHTSLEGVSEGEEGDVDVVGPDKLIVLGLVEQRSGGGKHVPVGEDHTLGIAGGARGVHDVSPVRRLRVHLLLALEAIRERSEFRERVELESKLLHLLLVRVGDVLPDNNILERRALTLGNVHHLALLARHRGELGVVDDVLDGVLSERVVQRRDRDTLRVGGEQRLGPFRSVDGVDADACLRVADAIPRLQAEHLPQRNTILHAVRPALLEGLECVVPTRAIRVVGAVPKKVPVLEPVVQQKHRFVN
eukprot:232370-Rhodomonas_salina.2